MTLNVPALTVTVVLVYLMAGIIVVPAVGLAMLARLLSSSFGDVARWTGWMGVAVTLSALVAHLA